MRILLVEDDSMLAETLTESLTDHQYVVDTAGDGEAAWEKVQSTEYNLILLDVMLPKIDGIRLCRRIRSHNITIPILIITALDTSTNQIEGLDAGADDYVIKPIKTPELLARIRALLRRSNYSSPQVLKWGVLELDLDAYEVIYDGKPLHLTSKEQGILELLVRSGRRVLKRNVIVENVWSTEHPPRDETINATIKSLRYKLRDVSAPDDFIETIHGVGYRLKQIS